MPVLTTTIYGIHCPAQLVLNEGGQEREVVDGGRRQWVVAAVNGGQRRRCKRLIRRVQCRLKLLKNKRECILRQSLEDIVQLIKSGRDECAFGRVGKLHLDQSIKDAYEILSCSCEFVIFQLRYIRCHRYAVTIYPPGNLQLDMNNLDCPNDISEAISNLVFGSARCGDLPELKKIRELFAARYGKIYVTTAVELLPGNLVNCQLIENLSVESVSDNIKFKLLKEIARDNHLELRPPRIEKLELQCQESCNPRCKTTDLRVQRKLLSELRMKQTIMKSERKHKSLTIQDMILQASPDIVASSSGETITKRVVGEEKHEQCRTLVTAGSKPATPSHNNLESSRRLLTLSPQISEKSVLGVNGIEEFQPSTNGSSGDNDQRLFTFKFDSPEPRRKGECGGHHRKGSSGSYSRRHFEDYMEFCYSLHNKTATMREFRSRKRSRRKRKRRYVYMDGLLYDMTMSPANSIRRLCDAECELYYAETGDSSTEAPFSSKAPTKRSCHGKKRNRNKTTHLSRELSYLQRTVSEGVRYDQCKHESDVQCSLDHPCYFPIVGESNCDLASSSPKTREKLKMRDHTRKDFASPPNPPNDLRAYYIPVLIFHDKRQYDQSEVEELEVSDYKATYASSCGSCSRAVSPWQNSLTLPPGLLNKRSPFSFHPLERRSQSCRSSSTSSHSHVHPKLPDYDDLVSQFRALKSEHLQTDLKKFATAH
ncbi:hypothetical protein Syun_008363 [Stephania yunnanensis]|uniref:Uncharacterized protein n=1 Tax=Stephania yunnanensis TaxID=152371 RepID=A0AAP0PPI6_9MAGN